jgi:hypothetical protein
MSAAFALVKFKTTGNIYYGCYEGTSDLLLPQICTPAECYDEKTGCYCAISHCRQLHALATDESWIISNDVLDLDDVEIYSDYGGGFYWAGHGSESIKKVNSWGDPWCDEASNCMDGRPEWVDEFLERLEKKHG